MTAARNEDARHVLRAGVLAVLCAVALSVTSYLLLVGWHRQQDYQQWRVIVLILILAATIASAAVLGTGPATATAVMITLTVTVTWSLDAASDPGGDGVSLWPIGAITVLFWSGVGAAAVVFVVTRIRSWRKRQRARVDPG